MPRPERKISASSPVAFLAIAVLLLSALGGFQAVHAPTADDRAALRHLKLVEWPRAYREQEVDLLDRILAEEFELIRFDGTRTSKEDELDHVRRHRPGYDTFSFDISRLDIFENGTAIVSGIGTVTGRDAAGPYTMTYSSSNVLIKRGATWRAIASHTSGHTTVRPSTTSIDHGGSNGCVPTRMVRPVRTPRSDASETPSA